MQLLTMVLKRSRSALIFSPKQTPAQWYCQSQVLEATPAE